MLDRTLLISDGYFFCQECFADFDHPERGELCPTCGTERISAADDEAHEQGT